MLVRRDQRRATVRSRSEKMMLNGCAVRHRHMRAAPALV